MAYYALNEYTILSKKEEKMSTLKIVNEKSNKISKGLVESSTSESLKVGDTVVYPTEVALELGNNLIVIKNEYILVIEKE